MYCSCDVSKNRLNGLQTDFDSVVTTVLMINQQEMKIHNENTNE